MNEAIVFPDAAALATQVVRAALPTIHTAGVKPKDAGHLDGRAEFVVVQRTGGISDSLVIDRAQLTVDCYAYKGLEAHDLAQLVRAHLNAAGNTVVGSSTIISINEVSGPQWFPDDGHPRYRQTFQLSARGVAL